MLFKKNILVPINKIRDCKDCDACEIIQPLFRLLTHDQLKFINGDRFEVAYKKGEMIYKQGTSYTHMISLTSGLVKLYMETRKKNLIYRIAKPVQLIGGPGIYTNGKRHNSATALTNVTACYLEIERFKHVIRENALFAEGFLKLVSQRTEDALDRLLSMYQKQTPGLVAEGLISLSVNTYDSSTFLSDLTRQDLADFCGLTKESLIRVLKDFKDAGYLTVNEDSFELLDLDALKRISELG